MALIDNIDGVNRKIYLSSSTVDSAIHPVDIYKEMRTLRENDVSLRRFNIFMEARGNIPKGGGKATERYAILKEGTLIVPYNTSHTLTVTGTIITDDGKEGVYCFDRSNLDAGVTVDINYVPPQVEVITVSSGSGLSQEEHDRLFSTPQDVWDIQL